jgi:hypothetical protein
LFSLPDKLPCFARKNKQKRQAGEAVKKTLVFFTATDAGNGV